MQAHHCSCPWERHTLCFRLTSKCRQIFYIVTTGCAEIEEKRMPLKQGQLRRLQVNQPSCELLKSGEQGATVLANLQHKSGNKKLGESCADTRTQFDELGCYDTRLPTQTASFASGCLGSLACVCCFVLRNKFHGARPAVVTVTLYVLGCCATGHKASAEIRPQHGILPICCQMTQISRLDCTICH